MKRQVFPWFALVVLGCVVALVLTMGVALSALLTQTVSSWEWQTTAALVQREAQMNRLWDVFDAGSTRVPTERGVEISQLFTSLPEVVRVKVWDRSATVVWFDEAELIGRRFPDNHALLEALAGRVAVERHAGLAEVYVPVTSGRGDVMGVVQVSKAPDRLLGAIRRGRRVIWAISLIGGAILSLVLLPLLTRVYRREVEERTPRAHAARPPAEVEERTARLLQAQTPQAVGLLAGRIAHDFNNLLTVIAGRGHLLRSRLAPDDPARVDADSILQTSEQATCLTRQLLAFSREQPHEPVTLDLNRLVADVEPVLRRLVPASVELTLGLERALGRVTVDPGQMEQVLLNLVVNARDAMPQGGRLTIATGNVDADAPLHVGPLDPPAGRYVVIAVGDSGIGMDAATQAHVFEPFFTTTAPGRGTGLRLSIVRGIVERHASHITVESAPGIGSTVRIYLPRTDAPTPAPQSVRTTPAATGTTGAIVLVAEDDPAVRAVTVAVLRQSGYTVLETSDGPAALAAAARHRGTIHLLVTDIVMPGMSGWELARRLAALRPETRTLFVTGYAPLEERDHPSEAVLLKPFTPAALARRVREVLDTQVMATV